MKDNKKLYIEANDEIKPSEKLKRITKNNILEKNKAKPNKLVLRLANVTLILLLVFSLIWLNRDNENKANEIDRIISPNVDVQKISKLPTVENKENLLSLLKKISTNQNMMAKSITQDTTFDVPMASEDSVGANTELNNFSETNVQVEGVKEADIVKTDGRYIYYLSTDKLVIVDTEEPNDIKIVKEVEFNTEVTDYKDRFIMEEMFLNEDRLVVIGTQYSYAGITPYEEVQSDESEMLLDIAVPIGYTTYTVAITYDISNKEEIVEIRTVETEGYYISSRMIGNDVYLITNKYIYLPYEYKEENLKDENILPVYRDTMEAEEKKLVNYDYICYFPNNISESGYLVITGFNLKENTPANINAYLGAGSNVYANLEHLYIASPKYTQTVMDQARAIIGMGDYEVTTEIYKFKLENSKVEYLTNGSVHGTILNQFSMDEYKGNFRIATTQSGMRNTEPTNNVYVLDSNLKTIGKIENLAKGETIYSVRFMEGKGYVVTFRQVDPLFVIDLEDATAPKVLGELKIPGYSDYLHPYDENHLIGFGRDTEVVNYGYGEQVVNKGMKMALFDVADAINPKELYAITIGDRGTYSEILDNHKSLLFSKEKNIIAFPISVIEGGEYSSTKLTFQGAIIYGLNLEEGFSLRGKITHISNGYQEYDYTKAIERIIYIGENLYTLSKGMIKATNMETMQELSVVEI